jgi:hypothetical protein
MASHRQFHLDGSTTWNCPWHAMDGADGADGAIGSDGSDGSNGVDGSM